MLCAGYIGSESFLEKVGETVMEMKKSNPKLVYGKCTACERHVFPALYLHLKVLPWNCLNCPKYVCKHIHVRMYILHGLLFGVLASFMYCAYIYIYMILHWYTKIRQTSRAGYIYNYCFSEFISPSYFAALFCRVLLKTACSHLKLVFTVYRWMFIFIFPSMWSSDGRQWKIGENTLLYLVYWKSEVY